MSVRHVVIFALAWLAPLLAVALLSDPAPPDFLVERTHAPPPRPERPGLAELVQRIRQQPDGAERLATANRPNPEVGTPHSSLLISDRRGLSGWLERLSPFAASPAFAHPAPGPTEMVFTPEVDDEGRRAGLRFFDREGQFRGGVWFESVKLTSTSPTNEAIQMAQGRIDFEPGPGWFILNLEMYCEHSCEAYVARDNRQRVREELARHRPKKDEWFNLPALLPPGGGPGGHHRWRLKFGLDTGKGTPGRIGSIGRITVVPYP